MTALYDLASIDALSGVATDTHEPFVQIRANSSYGQGRSAGDDVLDAVLVGQLDPPAARALAMSILEAADAAVFDAALLVLMLRRLEGDPTAGAKVAAILADIRQEREQRR